MKEEKDAWANPHATNESRYYRALPADVAIFAALFVANADGSQSIGHGEQVRKIEPRFDDDLARLVDETVFARFGATRADCSQPIGKRIREIELRLDDELTLLVDVAVFVAHAHVCEPIRKRKCRVELRRDDELAVRVDVAVLAAQKLANAGRGEPVGKRARGGKLRLDDELAAFADIAPFATNADHRQPSGERPRGSELRLDDDPALLVDITPCAAQELANANRGQTFRKWAYIDEFKFWNDCEISLLVDIAGFVADAGG